MATAGPLDAQPYLPGTQHHPCWLRRVFSLSWPSRSAKFNNHPAPVTTKASEFWRGARSLALWCMLSVQHEHLLCTEKVDQMQPQRNESCSEFSPTKAASSSHRKGSFAKCDHNLRTSFWCQHRKDYCFCNLADSSEASPVVTRQAFAHVWQTSKGTEDMEGVTRLGRTLGIKGTLLLVLPGHWVPPLWFAFECSLGFWRRE